MYKQMLINAKLQSAKRGQKQSWMREAHWVGEGLKLDCRAIEEKGESTLHNTNLQWNSFLNNMWTLRFCKNFGLIMESEELSGVLNSVP
jgi:hypothetical protein